MFDWQRRTLTAGLTAILVAAGSIAAHAQASDSDTARRASPPRIDTFREKVNENVVTIISGNPNGSFLFYAYDIAAAINDGDNLRVLPVVGRGGAHNVRDILYLRGIDMGITQSNTLTYYAKTGELGANIRRRIAYITRLFVDEMHILVRRDSGINTIADLKGKRLNFSDSGSGTELTTVLVTEALGVTPTKFNMGQADAIELIKKGELDATVCVCGSPIRGYARLTKDDGMKLITVPFSEPLESDYIPVTLTAETYPNLIDEGDRVETVGVSTVLATFNWPRNNPRYGRVARFVKRFFDNFDKMKQPPRREKWKTVNLAADLNNWSRFPAAQEWLDANKPKLEASAIGGAAVDEDLLRRQAEAAAPTDPAMQERLFQEFLEFVRQRERQAAN